jgi:sugar-specific transcriptional regulator TrmB
MELFRSPDHATGLLGKYLFSDVSHELAPLKGYVPMYLKSENALQVIHSLSGHRQLLRDVLTTAKEDVLIVSPFIAERALYADSLPSMIKAAVSRGVRVRVVADMKLNRNAIALKKCRTILTSAGAQVFLAQSKGIHCKVISRDRDLIASGSFNWLAAVREPSEFQRFEVTFLQEGILAAASITHVEADLREILGDKRKYLQSA